MCTVVIDFEEGESDRSSYVDMWMAAVAVNVMCVGKGQAGTAYGLGKSPFPSILMNDMLMLRRSGQDVEAFPRSFIVTILVHIFVSRLRSCLFRCNITCRFLDCCWEMFSLSGVLKDWSTYGPQGIRAVAYSKQPNW